MWNPRGTARMLQLGGDFDWGLSYRFTPLPALQVTAGGNVGMSGGVLYQLRNGNNPVTALASVGIGINASISYHFKIGRLPVVVEDRFKVPSLSVFFSPQYGETYYEIYLGNHSNLAHAGWWGNNSGINNRLSIYLDFGRTAMQIGYRADYRN